MQENHHKCSIKNTHQTERRVIRMCLSPYFFYSQFPIFCATIRKRVCDTNHWNSSFCLWAFLEPEEKQYLLINVCTKINNINKYTKKRNRKGLYIVIYHGQEEISRAMKLIPIPLLCKIRHFLLQIIKGYPFLSL